MVLRHGDSLMIRVAFYNSNAKATGKFDRFAARLLAHLEDINDA